MPRVPLVQKFVSEFSNIKDAVKGASDNGATFSRIRIYGAIPALGADHDIETPFIINERTGVFYQKSNNYTFDVVEDDTKEEIEEAA